MNSATPITNPLQKYAQRPTRGYAIRAKCAECVGCTVERTEPGYRQTIRDCMSKTCPLWVFRPYRAKESR